MVPGSAIPRQVPAPATVYADTVVQLARCCDEFHNYLGKAIEEGRNLWHRLPCRTIMGRR